VKLLHQNVPPNTVPAKKLQALVFDWAGTTVDFGSLAPARTIEQVFGSFGIALRESEIRRDMGLAKRDHIRRLLLLPGVCEAWRRLRGRLPTEEDLSEIYGRFVPLQLAVLRNYSALIPGVVESVARFRKRGLKIGSTTGYTRAMLDLLLEESAKAGYRPDASVSPEEVRSARPAPFMVYENAVRLAVSPLAAIAKVGDTPADIEEGLNAGVWAIGVAATGNAMGLPLAEFRALPREAQQARIESARAELAQAGAHYVVDSVAELDPVLDDIDRRLESGQS
jgi:phosphonoacetaldehyde hydrolase